jgi:solute carrier family 8 (sodium/calcium exchanger)
MFPVLVWVSWAEDQSWWGWFGSAQVSPEGETEEHGTSHVKSITGEDGKKRRPSSVSVVAHSVLKETDASAVKADPEAEAKRMAQEAMKKKKKSRLEYRIQATRKMTGGKRVMPTGKDKNKTEAEEVVADVPEEPKNQVKIDFQEKNTQVMESCDTCTIKVIRSGIIDKRVSVQFDTSDGDAISGSEYVQVAGSLTFEKNETEREITITIIDDQEWAPDKDFYVRLYAAKFEDKEEDTTLECVVGTATTTITILNDDDPGTVSFEEKTCHALDTSPAIVVPIQRKDGCDGNVLAFIKTVDGTAVAGTDYKPLTDETGEVHFKDQELKAEITIDLIKNAENQNCTFSLEIYSVEPEGAKLGENPTCTVIVSNDKNYQKLMEDVVAMMDDEMGKYGVGTSSWGEQFHDAMNMGGDDDNEPEMADYILHFLSFYWKVLHAFVPPTDMAGGWYTFVISLCFIGGITALVGDAAKVLGCCLGLEDSITAITFVALGTSLPDTFASMEATVSDETADAAITNVTGSNSVNVFLGLGLPWTMATVYHIANGTKYHYPAGSIVFSVLVFFAFAVVCIALLVFRRYYFDGELGGNKMFAYACSAFLGFSWFCYILLSSFQTVGHIG